MEIGCTDRVRNAEALHRVKEEKNILHTVKRRKSNLIGHIFCRTYLLKHGIQGNIKVTKRRGRRVSSYWITSEKREDTVTWKRKH